MTLDAGDANVIAQRLVLHGGAPTGTDDANTIANWLRAHWADVHHTDDEVEVNAYLERRGITFSQWAGGDGHLSGDDFFGQSLATGWYDNIQPAAKYYADIGLTVFAWQGSSDGGTTTDLRVKAYDHVAKKWTPEFIAATNMLADPTDTHDVPAQERDGDGHFFIYYGAHNTAQRIVSSVRPNDITEWQALSSLGSDTAYPHPGFDGAQMNLLVRSEGRYCRWYRTTSITAGVPTWADVVTLIDFGSGTRFYPGTLHVVDGKLHFSACQANQADEFRRNLYRFTLDPVTGDVTNFAGDVTVEFANLPVDLTTANASFRIFQHAGGDDWTAGPDWCFDDEGREHHLITSGDPGGFDVDVLGDLLHYWWDGAAWQTDVLRDGTYQVVVGGGIVQGPDGSVEAWYPFDDGDVWAGQGGNIYRQIWTPTGGMGAPQLIRTATDFRLKAPEYVADAHPDARIIFSEGPLNGVSDFGSLKGFAYGDSGYLRRGGQYIGGAGRFDNEEASAWHDSLLGQVPDDDIWLIDRLFGVLKDIGIAKFDRCIPLRLTSTDEADALRDIISGVSAVNNGAVYTPGAGFTTDGSESFIATSWNPGTAGGAYGQNGGHFGAYFVDTGQVAASAVGQFDGADGMTLAPRSTGGGGSGNITFRVNQASISSTANSGNTNGRGLYIANRSASNATQVYKNNAAVAVTSGANQTSTALNNAEVMLGLVAGTFTAHQFAAFISGGSLTAGEVADLYNLGIRPIMAFKGLA